MSRIRFSKVRITDHRRPPGAGRVSPLERQGATRGGSVAGMTGLERIAANQAREAAEHDRNIQDYTPAMMPAIYDDVCRKISEFPSFGLTKDEKWELLWLKQRKAALLRLGSTMRKPQYQTLRKP